jgi:alkylation response protein AidB-like acyl-CoA dehydrogenase
MNHTDTKREINTMDFSQTENQKMIAETIRRFAETSIRPEMMVWDEAQIFPIDLFKKMGELGLMGILVPTEYWPFNGCP